MPNLISGLCVRHVRSYPIPLLGSLVTAVGNVQGGNVTEREECKMLHFTGCQPQCHHSNLLLVLCSLNVESGRRLAVDLQTTIAVIAGESAGLRTESLGQLVDWQMRQGSWKNMQHFT